MDEFRWSLSFLQPYRARVVAVVALAFVEVGLSALAPWPLKAMVDNVFGGRPFPEPLQSLAVSVTGGQTPVLLVLVALAGFVLQLLHELARAGNTQLQVATGQRIV